MHGLIGCLLVSTSTSSPIAGACETVPIGASVVGQPVIVTSLVPDGPAAVAGLARGDIVLKVDGRSIKNRFQFEQLTSNVCSGARVSVVVDRNGRSISLTMSPKPRDPMEEMAVRTSTIGSSAELNGSRSNQRWYGWEALAMDFTALIAGSIGMTLLFLSEGDSVPGAISSALGGFAWIATPVNHAMRGRWKAFAWSAIMRLVVPAVSLGIALGVGLGGACSSDGCAIGLASAGSVIAGSGIFASTMVDGWTSWDTP